MTIAVDFDGTIVEHDCPRIGKEKPFAIDALKALAAQGNRIILWTARDGELLEDAVAFSRKRGFEFYAVNSNYPAGAMFGDSRENPSKVIADVYIDDRNLGGIPDWTTIYRMLSNEDKPRHHKRSLMRKVFG